MIMDEWGLTFKDSLVYWNGKEYLLSTEERKIIQKRHSIGGIYFKNFLWNTK